MKKSLHIAYEMNFITMVLNKTEKKKLINAAGMLKSGNSQDIIREKLKHQDRKSSIYNGLLSDGSKLR